MNLIIIILIYLGLTVWDGILTYQLLRRPGARELNPLLRLLIKSPALFWTVKLLAVAFIGACLYFLQYHRLYWGTVVVCGLIFAFPVVWNLIQKHRR